MVDAQALGGAVGEALHDDVGALGQSEEGREPGLGAKIEASAALAAMPDPVSRLPGKGIATRRLDPRDLRAVVGEEHRGHRTGDPPGEIEHTYAIKDPRHRPEPTNSRLAITMALDRHARNP